MKKYRLGAPTSEPTITFYESRASLDKRSGYGVMMNISGFKIIWHKNNCMDNWKSTQLLS